MNLKELKEIVQLVVSHEINEFEYERAGTRIRIRKGPQEIHTVTTSPSMGPTTPLAPSISHISPPLSGPVVDSTESAAPTENLQPIRSPIVGTFYRSPSPGAPSFVKVGDQVEIGTVLCIIEAMKLMNEIESDVAGEIVKILVENSQPVEYGEELFLIRPRQ
jgi:acetyl-CoA carboxylase biotin carboxyl carrier protein